jgi:hypothetical protein
MRADYPGEVTMSNSSIQTAGVLFVIIPTIMFGGYALLRMLANRDPAYLDHPIRQDLFRAGHAHAGVLVILSLVALLLVDRADLSDGAKAVVRYTIPAAAILMSAGFFLCIAPPSTMRPNRLIALVYLGAISLVIGTVTLGIGLLRAT